MRVRSGLLALLVLALAASPTAAQHDYGTISIMRPEPGTKAAAKKRHITRHGKKQHHREHEAVAPLPNVPRGSSNPVYPIPLPGPQKPLPVPHREVTAPPIPKTPPPLLVPETGRTLPNLPPSVGSGPGGRETFQERATRCAHQAGIYGPAAGSPSAYINSCINQ